MGLFIGNITKGNTILDYISNTTLSGHKVWGVTFNGTSTAGIRLYDAIGLKWTVSSAAAAGIDDFTLTNNGNSPFHIRKCVRQYDTTTKTSTYTFKDTDPTGYASLIASKTGDRMIAFPKFYYKRPDEWTFLVSNDPIDGFLPSPMHFKRPALGMDKVMSDYVYVCEFNYSGVPSQPGTPTVNLTIKQFRDIATSNGMRLEDIETRMMVGMLSAIKYASFNSRSAVGTTAYSEANQYD